MKAPFSILTFFLLVPLGVADIIYDVNFEDPPHVLDSAVVSGSAADRPSTVVPDVIVRDSLGDFTSQVASLEGGGIMAFNPTPVFDSGVALFSWDLAMLSTGGIELEQAYVSIDPEPATGGGALIFLFMLNGDIEFNGTPIATYTLGSQDAFEVAVDLNNDLYDVTLNSSPILADVPLSAGWSPDLVTFGRGFTADPRYAVDNFQWQIIPEPSTIALMLLALGGLAVGRVRR